MSGSILYVDTEFSEEKKPKNLNRIVQINLNTITLSLYTKLNRIFILTKSEVLSSAAAKYIEMAQKTWD